MIDLLRGYGTATGGIDAQHDGLHVIVIGQLVEVVDSLLANDVMLGGEHAGFLVDDFAIGVVDGHLIALLVCGGQGYHVAEQQLVDVVVEVGPQKAVDGWLYFFRIAECINESSFQVVGR